MQEVIESPYILKHTLFEIANEMNEKTNTEGKKLEAQKIIQDMKRGK